MFGSDVIAAGENLSRYESTVKSLHQAAKKATNQLIKFTNRAKAKEEQNQQKKQKQPNDKNKHNLEQMQIDPDDYDFETTPDACQWQLYRDSIRGDLPSPNSLIRVDCTSKADKSGHAESAELDHAGALDQCVLLEDESIPDAFSEAMREILPLAEGIRPDDISSYTKLQKRLGFPDFEEMLNPVMAKYLQPFSWALSTYLRTPSNRTKPLDRYLSLRFNGMYVVVSVLHCVFI